MTSLMKYQLATMLHAQRYPAPVLLFMAAPGAFPSNSPGPLAPLYGTYGAAMLLSSTWFTMTLVSMEDPTHRALSAIAVGSSRWVLLALVAVELVAARFLTLAGLVLSLLIARHVPTRFDLAVGMEAQLTCAPFRNRRRTVVFSIGLSKTGIRVDSGDDLWSARFAATWNATYKHAVPVAGSGRDIGRFGGPFGRPDDAGRSASRPQCCDYSHGHRQGGTDLRPPLSTTLNLLKGLIMGPR